MIPMKKVLASFTREQLEELDKLVEKLGYSSRSEALRDAVKLLFAAQVSPQIKDILKKLQEKSEKIKKALPNQIENKILSAVKKNPDGLSFLQISKLSNLHRHTVRKYVGKLTREGRVFLKRIGPAKICLPSKRRVL